MPPNPSFNESPRQVRKVEENPLIEEATNEPLFALDEMKSLESLSVNELFSKRRAHEVQLKLGYRDPKIDTDIIALIMECAKSKGVTEEDYTAFLENPHDVS